MLEIVYDVAPGAPLAFHTGGGGPTVFANAIRALAAAGSKVIVDDLGYANSPHFTPGRMGMAVDDVVRQGAVYVTAGGNDGDYAWKGVWRGRSATVDGIAGTYMDFNGSALQTFTLAANETVTMKFAWDATFLEGGDPAARFQVPNDLVVYIVDVGANNILATFDDINPTTDEAFEFIDYTNTSGATNLAYAFRLKSGAAPARISWIDFGSSVDIQAQGQGATTLYGQVLAASALTIAAADAATPTVPEPFTALGGQLEIFSDDQGNRFAAPVLRQKPEVTGPDGVHTSFFGQDDGQGGFQFFGTSAAAPHVAAAAALLLQQQPTAKHVDIVQHMQNTAMDIGAPGVDALTGYGMVQVQQFKLSGPGSDDSSGALEPNEDSSRSFHLGTIGAFAQTVSGLAIGTTPLGLPDYDWFTFNAANAGRVNVTMNNSNLEMHLFLENGGFLTEIGNGTLVPAGRKIYIEVKGRSIAPGRLSQGAYQLTISVA
jgi:subtilisin family serine protease